MGILAVIEAITKVLDLFNAIVETVQTVESFYDDPDEENKKRYETTMEEIIRSRDELLDASTSILGAIQQLDQTIFRERMSDKIGNIAQAEQALDNFLRTGDIVQRSAALDASAGALADLLQYITDRTYPAEAVLVNLIQALPRRMMILKQADTGFCFSNVAKAPIIEAISKIRDTATSIEAAIFSANQIRERTFTRRRVVIRPASEGGGREYIYINVFEIRYKNASGSAAFSDEVTSETEEGDDNPDFVEAIEHLKDAANAARQRGLTDDLSSAGISQMRRIAEIAFVTLNKCEARHLMQLVSGREMNFVERAEFVRSRRTMGVKEATLRLLQSSRLQPASVSDFADSAAHIQRLSKGLINRPLTEVEEAALVAVQKAFGSDQAATLMINHPDSTIG